MRWRRRENGSREATEGSTTTTTPAASTASPGRTTVKSKTDTDPTDIPGNDTEEALAGNVKNDGKDAKICESRYQDWKTFGG